MPPWRLLSIHLTPIERKGSVIPDPLCTSSSTFPCGVTPAALHMNPRLASTILCSSGVKGGGPATTSAHCRLVYFARAALHLLVSHALKPSATCASFYPCPSKTGVSSSSRRSAALKYAFEDW